MLVSQFEISPLVSFTPVVLSEENNCTDTFGRVSVLSRTFSNVLCAAPFLNLSHLVKSKCSGKLDCTAQSNITKSCFLRGCRISVKRINPTKGFLALKYFSNSFCHLCLTLSGTLANP